MMNRLQLTPSSSPRHIMSIFLGLSALYTLEALAAPPCPRARRVLRPLRLRQKLAPSLPRPPPSPPPPPPRPPRPPDRPSLAASFSAGADEIRDRVGEGLQALGQRHGNAPFVTPRRG